MPRDPSKKQDLEWRRLQVSKRYAAGHSAGQIARSLGIAQSLVEHDIGVIRSEWSRRRFQNVDTVVGRELDKLDIIDSAMLARLLKPDGFGIDVRAAAVIVKSMERRARMLGLDAPKAVDITPLLEQLAVAAGVDMALIQMAASEIMATKKRLDGAWVPLPTSAADALPALGPASAASEEAEGDTSDD